MTRSLTAALCVLLVMLSARLQALNTAVRKSHGGWKALPRSGQILAQRYKSPPPQPHVAGNIYIIRLD